METTVIINYWSADLLAALIRHNFVAQRHDAHSIAVTCIGIGALDLLSDFLRNYE